MNLFIISAFGTLLLAADAGQRAGDNFKLFFGPTGATAGLLFGVFLYLIAFSFTQFTMKSALRNKNSLIGKTLDWFVALLHVSLPFIASFAIGRMANK